MILFNAMLLGPAMQAGMKVPDIKEVDNFDEEDYPHFALFCMVQIGRPLRTWREHFFNAHLINELSEDEIFNLDAEGLEKLGLK